MARVDEGDKLERLAMQPGRQLQYDQYGVISGTVDYKIDAALAFARAPLIGSFHPDTKLAQAWNNSFNFIENDICVITTSYLGIVNDPSGYKVEYLGGTSEEPIETHSQFVSAIGGTKASPKNQAKFDEETGEFLGFPPDAPSNLGGVRGYLDSNVVARVTWYTRNGMDGLSDLGHRASPRGNVVTPPGGRNWLLSNWGRSDYGLIYQIVADFTCSGRRGWNSLIY